MIDYNTNQWMIMHYPQAAGGKFLATCFMMFDNVINWKGQDSTPEELVTWYKNSLPNTETWYATEIDTPWVIPASRLWPRGEELSSLDFWEAFTPTDWFTQNWNQKKFIVDFWHKPTKPLWWANALWINITIDDNELYKKILFTKVFEYNKEERSIVWTSQLPSLGRPEAVKNKAKYQNQWKWDNVDDLDHFYNNIVLQHECFQWSYPDASDKSIALSELFDVDKVVNFLLQFENKLLNNLNVSCVKQIHKHWISATNKLL